MRKQQIEAGKRWLMNKAEVLMPHYGLQEFDWDVDSDFCPHAEEVYVWLEVEVDDETYERMQEAIDNQPEYSKFFLDMAKADNWDYPNAELSYQEGNIIRFEINRLY